jgi:hypothetical protein
MDRITYKILALILLLLPLPTAARCLPMFFCPQGYEELDYFRGPVGWHLAWFTQSPVDGKIYSDGLSCKHGVCNLGAFGDYIRLSRLDPDEYARGVDALEKLKALGKIDCVAEKPLCDERATWLDTKRPMAEAMFALKAAPIPPLPPVLPAITYVVRSNGTNLTRPAYPVVNGVRGTVEVGRATVGASCTLSLGEYGTFGPLHAPNIVALCSLKK